MSEPIRLLHLYSQTMDLYGDYCNLTALRQRVEEAGLACEIDTQELGDTLNLSGYNLVYLGHGKARNLCAIAEHFCGYGRHMIEQIESDQLFFITGNARLLFGRSFEGPDGKSHPGIGLFDYTGIETNNVFVSDVVAAPVFDSSLQTYGFVNRTSYMEGENTRPLFLVRHGCGDGKTPDGKEGTLYRNFFGTWQMGPLLPRNPGLLRELLRRMLGERYREGDYRLEEKALSLTLSEFR